LERKEAIRMEAVDQVMPLDELPMSLATPKKMGL
jgi:hypothetical protein